MSHLIKPSDIESTVKDIINYYAKSEADHDDKMRVLKMLQEHYELTNYSVIDQWLAQLIKRVISKYEPNPEEQIGFEEKQPIV